MSTQPDPPTLQPPVFDAFATFGLSRRPWYEPARLQERFHQLSLDHHPDRFVDPVARAAAESRYAEINRAFQTLREPHTRVRHLAELLAGVKLESVQSVQPAHADLFMEVAGFCRRADQVLSDRDREKSPLMRATKIRRCLALVPEAERLRGVIEGRLAEVEGELRRIDQGEVWGGPDLAPIAQEVVKKIQDLATVLIFFTRWTEQVNQRWTQLGLF